MENTNPKPVIVAMKGHPGTGKSTLARAIATALRCPLLDKDDLYTPCRSLFHHLLSSSSHSAASRLLNDLSYHSLWSVAAAQLRLGLSVVVDSPLSNRSRLHRLRQIAHDAGRAVGVVIVECRPADEGEWRRRLERRAEVGGASWHKPATWADLERLVESYGGCHEYDVGDVPKLMVDTTAPIRMDDVMAFITSHSKIND